MSDTCLKFNAQNCGWAVQFKSICLAFFLTANLFTAFASDLAYVTIFCFKTVVCMLLVHETIFLTFSFIPEFIRWIVLPIHLYVLIFPLIPFFHGLIFFLPPPTMPDIPFPVFPHSDPRGRERHSGLFMIVHTLSVLWIFNCWCYSRAQYIHQFLCICLFCIHGKQVRHLA